MSDPKFVPIPLKEFVESGTMVAVNERILWPLGVALTVDFDSATGEYTNLHVRQWEFEDGHHECIEEAADDPVMAERHRAFFDYVQERTATMPEEEAAEALLLLDWSEPWDNLLDPVE